MDDELMLENDQQNNMDYAGPVEPEGLALVLVAFTTIFLVVGISLVFFELNNNYDFPDSGKKTLTRTK